MTVLVSPRACTDILAVTRSSVFLNAPSLHTTPCVMPQMHLEKREEIP